MATEQMSFNQVHADRLRKWREAMSEMLYQKPAALSLGGAVSLLIDIAEWHREAGSPPPTASLREWAARYPRKGRQRTREGPTFKRGAETNVTGSLVAKGPGPDRGHALRRLREDPSIRQCSKCGMVFLSDDAVVACAYEDRPKHFRCDAFTAHLAAHPVDWLPREESGEGGADKAGSGGSGEPQ